MGAEGKIHDLEHLPYYMEAVEQGNACKWCGKPQYGMEDREEPIEED